MRGYLVAVALSAPLLGCGFIQDDYESPEISVPARFVGGPSSALSDAAYLAWWQTLRDPLLDQLVRTGLRQNLDAQAALERIRAAAAAARGAGVPEQVSGNASADWRRIRDTDGNITEEGTFGADAGFVLDLFGGFTASRAQSLARLDAAQFDAGAVRLAYLADIVNAYVFARYFQNAAAITRQSIASRRQTLGLVQNRFAAEEATSLELAQARSLLATAEASLPILEANFRVNAFRIATLVNEPAAEVLRRMNSGRAQPRPHGSMATGIPADLLRNRPDVRAAERAFAAAVAEIGVAEAQLYPSLQLGGNITGGDVRSWAFGPSITIPLLNLPLRISNRDVAMARAREAELIYRQTVLRAIEETQSALALTQFQRRQVGSYQAATSAAGEVLNLSRTSYEQDAVTIIDVLDAERTLLSNRLELARAIRDWSASWIRLQVSVGKGWLAGAQVVRVETR